jgi:hypothetical protein
VDVVEAVAVQSASLMLKTVHTCKREAMRSWMILNE